MMGVLEPLSPTTSIVTGSMASSVSERTRLLDEEGCDSPTKQSSDDATPEIQEGVEAVEAITLVWSKGSLRLTYAFILLIYALNSIQTQVTSNLTAYVVSGFSAHSLMPVIGIVSGILSGVLRLPIAKLLDIWGRAEGFALMAVIATVGLVLMATCRSIETYAAAQVFYAVGFGGISYVLNIIIADISSMANRALAMSLASSPYIITTIVGPQIAQKCYETIGFRWAFAIFAVLTPIVAAPVFYILYSNQHKAKDLGVRHSGSQGRWEQTLAHYVDELNVFGVLVLSAGFVLVLLPISLTGYEGSTWLLRHTKSTISIGFLLLLAFGVRERFFASKMFMQYQLLLDKTIMGACLLCATRFIAFQCWDGYYTSYLQVVNGLSIAEAGYIANIFTIGSCILAIVVGWLIRTTGRFKWIAWVALPVEILGGALMIYFRRPYQHIAYVVMCQVFIAVAGGAIVMCEQIAVMAVVEHSQVASIMALYGLFAAIGGAVGSSVSGAIWTNTLPNALLTRLPEYARGNATAIYEDLALQLSYPQGSEVRDAIIGAYGEAQFRMCVAGSAILMFGFVWVSLWKDVKVSELKQNKGTVL